MTAVYGEDDWPMWALERRLSADPKETLYRLFDQDRVYWLSVRGSAAPVYVSEDIHGVGVVPAVRFRPIDDLDDETLGEIDDLMVLQDQIDVTTFGLLVAQHYGAFRQRYVLGWLAETEEQKLTAMASRLWTFEENKDEMAVGEFSQTDLKGYLDSREASIRHLASVSQTPAHELFGESWEQVFELGDEMAGRTVDYGAEVRWRDTEARALAATVDALGKMAQMLMIPPEMLWEKIPGVSTKDVARWKDAAARGDSLASLEELLRVQATEV
jgi:hypothetical protein